MEDFEQFFDGYDVPEYIKSRSIAIMKRFCINGLCDGMYIANVIANQNGMGNGDGEFNGEEHVIDARMTGKFLANAYGCSIFQDEIDDLETILSYGKLDCRAAYRGLEKHIRHLKEEKRHTTDEWRRDYIDTQIKAARLAMANV